MAWQATHSDVSWCTLDDAVEHAAAPRRIGVPRIARGQNVIERGAHGRPRIAIGRRVVNAGAQLVLRMAGAHARRSKCPGLFRTRGVNLLPGSACTSCGSVTGSSPS